MPRKLVDQLWRGESDQPPQTRLGGQVQAAINCRLDVTVSGPVRRGPTRLIADLAALTASNLYHIEQIRDCLLFIRQDEIKAFRITDGLELTVVDASPTGDFNQYLQTPGTTPLTPDDIVSTVSVDTAIIANRIKTIDTLQTWTYQQIYNFIATGDEDGTGADAINDRTITAPVSKFSDLDTAPPDGTVDLVSLDENLDPHGIYVFHSGAPHANFPEGFYPASDGWYRIPLKLQPEGRFDPTTMPLIAVYDEDNDTVTVAPAPWRHRISGNTGSNAAASIVGTEVADIFFLQGRLGFITREHLVTSRDGDFFNFWLNNTNAPDDEDRIDREMLTFKNLGRPLRVLLLGNSLVIGLELGQLAFTSGSANMTSTNGRFRVLTKFATQDVEPGHSGDVGYLVDRRGFVHQYGIFDGGGNAVPAYMGWTNIHRFRLTRGKTVDRLFGLDRSMFITTTGGTALAYDTFSQNNEVVQSAWSQLAFWENPVYFAQWNDRIYIVTRDATDGYSIVDYKHYDEEAPSGMVWAPTLDRLEIVGGVYDEDENETTFQHTGRDGVLESSKIVVTTTGMVHQLPNVKRIEQNGDVVVEGGSGEEGDWDAASTGTSHFIGFAFLAEVELNEFWPNLDETVLVVNKLTIHHFESSDYQVVIPKADRDDEVYDFEARRLPVELGVAGSHTGFYRVEASFDGRKTRPRIRSSSPGRFTIVAVAYEFDKQESD